MRDGVVLGVCNVADVWIVSQYGLCRGGDTEDAGTAPPTPSTTPCSICSSSASASPQTQILASSPPVTMTSPCTKVDLTCKVVNCTVMTQKQKQCNNQNRTKRSDPVGPSFIVAELEYRSGVSICEDGPGTNSANEPCPPQLTSIGTMIQRHQYGLSWAIVATTDI